MKRRSIKEKVIGGAGAASAATSALGGYQVCHGVCMAAIGALGLIGITVSGMPLFFLTKVAVPFWIVAVAMLAALGYMHFRKKCVPGKLMIANLGLIIAGTPFPPFSQHPAVMWGIGGALVAVAIFLYAKGKIYGKKK